jgi:hypothetical protein
MVLELYQSDPLKGFLSKYHLHLNLKLAEIQTVQCFYVIIAFQTNINNFVIFTISVMVNIFDQIYSIFWLNYLLKNLYF